MIPGPAVCRRIVGLAGLAMLLTGCTTVQPGGKTGRSAVYVGIVRVQWPEAAGQTQALSVKTLGVGWEAGPYLGWKSGQWVVADPRDCQLLIIIRSAAQAENAVQILESLKGQKPCIANFASASR